LPSDWLGVLRYCTSQVIGWEDHLRSDL